MTPRVEWALFCKSYTEDSDANLSPQSVLHTIPSQVGSVQLWLVACLSGPPTGTADLRVLFAPPDGNGHNTGNRTVMFNAFGRVNIMMETPIIELSTPGVYHAHFFLNGDRRAGHTARLQLWNMAVVPPSVTRPH